jgi:hypothetical protein
MSSFWKDRIFSMPGVFFSFSSIWQCSIDMVTVTRIRFSQESEFLGGRPD